MIERILSIPVAMDDDGATRNAAIRRDYRAGERRYGLGRVQLWRIINDVPNR